jgi:hypothetical protein
VKAFLGYANDVKTRYCAEHMPGLLEADREGSRGVAAMTLDPAPLMNGRSAELARLTRKRRFPF